MIRKLHVKNAEGEREVLLDGPVCVGRDIDCEISDNDALLSRRHAEFVSARTGVTVRDLNSLNGITVNGRHVDEVRLVPGDVVEIGNLSLTFVEDSDSVSVNPGYADADQTVLVTPGSISQPIEKVEAVIPSEDPDLSPADGTQHQPAVVSAESSPAVPEGTVSQAQRTGGGADAGDGDDPTILVTPGSVPPVLPSGRGEAPAPAGPTESDDQLDDRTILVTPGGVPPALPIGRDVKPEPAGELRADEKQSNEHTLIARTDLPNAQPVAEGASENQTEPEPSGKRRVPRASWAGRVLIQVVALAALVLLMTALPMHFYQERLLESVAEERANALVHWLAADASAALTTQATDIGSVADEVGMQPGVIGALIMTPDGQVLAPGARGGEFVEMIPGISAPDDIHRPQWVWNGESVEIVQPVEVSNDPRAAVAWLTFRPAALPAIQSNLVVLAPAILIALVGGLVVAGLIRRTTFRALTALNEDVELAMAGQLAHIEDRLGAKPVRDLAMNVSHLIMRIRTVSAAASRPRVRGVGGARSAAMPGVGQARSLVARLVTDSKFRITDASPDCEQVLAMPIRDLIGQHVIDAIRDKNITDELLRCLGVVAEGGEAQAMIKPTDKIPGMALVLARDKKDGPLTITLTAGSSVNS